MTQPAIKTQTEFPVLIGEQWLAERLGLHGVKIFDGVTDQTERRERFRAAILDAGLELVVCGRGSDGKPNNYRQAFERLYHTQLTDKPKREKR